MTAPGRLRTALDRLAGQLGCALLLAAPALPQTVQAQGSTAAAPAFEIKHFVVGGDTLLGAPRIQALLAPYTGAARTFVDIQAALAALQAAYTQAGYGATQVRLPQQKVSAGTVELLVLEPRLGDLTLTGNLHFDDAAIARSLPSLQIGVPLSGQPLNTDALARELRLANENPARRISVELKSRPNGLIDAIVKVHDEGPWKVGLQLDDSGTPATGRTRAGMSIQHANVAGLGHVANFQAIGSPEQPDKVAIAALNYRIPLPALGDSIDFFGLRADVDSGVVNDLISVSGRGTVAGLRYTANLRPVALYQQRLIFGLARRKFDNRVGVVGGQPNLVPDVAVLPASLSYAGAWNGATDQLDFSASWVQNVPAGSQGNAAAMAAARSGASAHYSILRYALNLTHAFESAWLARFALDGQATRDALIAGEQFGVGGQDSVRGFLERELTNDIGGRATLELQTPSWGSGKGLNARALVFYDQGWLRRNAALPGETASATLSSAGLGLRVNFAPCTLRADAARVIRGGGARAEGDQRLHLGAACAF